MQRVTNKNLMQVSPSEVMNEAVFKATGRIMSKVSNCNCLMDEIRADGYFYKELIRNNYFDGKSVCVCLFVCNVISIVNRQVTHFFLHGMNFPRISSSAQSGAEG